MPKKPLGEWLYNQSPWLVTLVGYIFGLAVILGAASTWFIHTSVSAHAAGVLRPEAETYVFPTETVLLACLVTAGQEVQAGTPLARLAVESDEVASHGLSVELRNQIAQASERGDAETAERYRAMLALIPQETTPLELTAGRAGRVTDLAAVAEGGMVPANEPLMRVAHDGGVQIQTTLSPDRMPTIGSGDTVQVLLPQWDTTPIPARVADVTVTGVFSVPAADLPASWLGDSDASPREADMEAGGATYAVQLSQTGEEVVCRVTFGAAASRPETKVGRRLAAALLGSERLEITSKWSAFETELLLRVEASSLPEGAYGALHENLAAGHYTLPADDVWVETGHCRLSSRLFSK